MKSTIATTSARSNPVMDRYISRMGDKMPQMGLFAVVLIALYLMSRMLPKNKKLAKGGLGNGDLLKRSRRKGLKEVATNLNDAVLWLGNPEDRDSIFLRSALPGVLVEGGPNSGKTYSVFNQLMLSTVYQGWGTIIVDFKYPKQTSRIADYAKRCGYEVGVLAPTFPETGTLNPVELLRSHTDTIKAEELIKVAKLNLNKSSTQGDGDKFWDDASTQILTAGLCLIKTWHYPDILTLRSLLMLDDLPQRLRDNRDDIPASVYTKFGQLFSAENNPRQYAALLSTCLQLLDKMTAMEFLPAIVGNTTVPIDLDRKQMLIIGLNRDYKEVLAPTLSTFIHAIIERNLNKDRETPLAFYCDEIPGLHLPKISNWLNEGREDGFCGILGFQTHHQMIATYGKEKARTIYTGTPTKFFMNPNDIEVAAEIAKWTGEIEVDYKLKSRNRGKGSTSRNTSDQIKVKLALEASEINRFPQGTALIVSPGFENGKEAFIPIKHSIKVPKKSQDIIKIATQRWKTHLRPELIANGQAKQYGDDDVRERMLYAEEKLPLIDFED